jgi:hypothetical protein
MRVGRAVGVGVEFCEWGEMERRGGGGSGER